MTTNSICPSRLLARLGSAAVVGSMALTSTSVGQVPGAVDDRPVLGTVKPFHRLPHLQAMQADAMALDIDPIDLDEIARPGRWRIEDLPVDLATDVDLVVEPFSVGARGVKSVVVDEHGRERRIPRLARFWRGHVAGDEASRVFLADSPAGFFGWVQHDGRKYVISSGDPKGDRIPVVYDLEGPAGERIKWVPFECGADGIEQPFLGMAPQPPQGGLAGTVCQTVELALETDQEFRNLFGSDAAAQGYLETLVAGTNEIYRRDTDVQFTIAYTRLWNSTDPWNASGTSAQLTQFRDYWQANMGSVQRDLAHFVSGRGLGGGVAWVSAACSSYAYAVSANINGSFPTPLQDHSSQNWDIIVFAHELGHNLGTFHTHDIDQYNPVIDGCGLGDCSSAYGGTIMSYCHTCSGGLSNIVLQFHPRVQLNIEAFATGAACLADEACGDPTADSDGDGILDGDDNCPDVANGDQSDADGDGVGDVCDGCPNDPDRTEPGACGCNAPADDSDGDGVVDCEDGCPNDPDKTEPGTCGCGVSDGDSDGDGVVDCNDACPNDPYTSVASGSCGCGSIDADWNGDGTLDCNGVVFDMGSFTLSGGQSATVVIEGYTGTMTGFALAMDYDGSGGTWASDMVAAFHNGTAGIEVGGYDTSFGYPSIGSWAFDGSGSAGDGIYLDAMPATIGIVPGQTFAFKIMNGWTSAPATSYANVRIVVFGIEPDDPCATLGATAATTSFSSGGGTGIDLAVATGAGCAWTATSDASWITLSSSGGSGDAGVTFDVALNGTASARSATITVDSSAADAVVLSISQDANPCAADSDGDGIGDCDDGCPSDPSKASPGTCGCGVADTDSDGDGTPDCNDGCPSDPNKTSPGACGCGVSDADSDSDGTPDCNDGCPADPNKTSPGACGCGVSDADSDSDGTPDCNDGCPADPNKTSPGACGCGVDDATAVDWWPDADGDGYGDAAAATTSACVQPTGHVDNGLDCDDGNSAIRPGAVEICGDGLDNDCNGQIDETCSDLVTFLGFAGEAVETSVDGVAYARIDLYATFDSASVEVVNVYAATIENTLGSPFVQNDFAGGTWSPMLSNPSTIGIDSFVTVGGDLAVPSSNTTTFDPGFPDASATVPPAGAGWYNSNPANLQGFTDAEGRVLVARFTIVPTGAEEMLSVTASTSFAGYPGGETQQQTGTVEIAWPVSACPADLDGDGEVTGADIGLMLLDWGSNSATSDLDGDGVVDGADIGLMLLDWGPCL